MRRLVLTALIVVGIAVAAVAAARVIISDRLAAMEIADRMSTLTGERVTVHGKPVVTFFPSPGVEVSDVLVSGAAGSGDQPHLSIPAVHASLSLVPLLAGRVDIGTLTLVDPHIRLQRRPGDGAGWSAADAGRLISGLRSLRLDEVILRNGSVTYERHPGGGKIGIKSINLALARVGRAVELSGTLGWRDAMVEIDAALDDAPALFDRKESDGRLRLAAKPVRASQESGADSKEDDSWHKDRSIQSLKHFVERLGISIAPGSTFGPLLVAGTFEADEESLTLSDATLELDGDKADGTFAVRLGGDRPMLKGALIFERLALGRHLKRFPGAALTELFAAPISNGWLSRADVDLAASADEVDLGSARLTGASVVVFGRRGRMSLNLVEARLAGGGLRGRMTVQAGDEYLAASMSACLDKVSTAEVAGMFQAGQPDRLIGTGRSLRGTGTLRLEMAATGDTISDLTESLSGVVAADIRDGTVEGIDVESTLERLADGSTVIAGGDAPFIPTMGRSGFDSLSTYVAIDDGTARAGRVRLDGDRYNVTLSGEGDLARGEIEAEGIASLFTSGSSGHAADWQPLVQLPFGVGGTMRQPMIAPGIPRVGHGPYMETEPSLEYSGSLPRPVDVPRTSADRAGRYHGTYIRCGSGPRFFP